MKAKILLPLLIAALGIAIDQLSKVWAMGNLTIEEYIPVIGDFFGIQLKYNYGAAFSFLSSSTLIITLIALAAILALPYAAYRSSSLAWRISLALIWSGAVGNFIDRIIHDPGIGRGYVVDFLAYGDLFVGNIADIVLVLGVILSVVLSFRGVAFSPETQEDVSSGDQLSNAGNSQVDHA